MGQLPSRKLRQLPGEEALFQTVLPGKKFSKNPLHLLPETSVEP